MIWILEHDSGSDSIASALVITYLRELVDEIMEQLFLSLNSLVRGMFQLLLRAIVQGLGEREDQDDRLVEPIADLRSQLDWHK